MTDTHAGPYVAQLRSPPSLRTIVCFASIIGALAGCGSTRATTAHEPDGSTASDGGQIGNDSSSAGEDAGIVDAGGGDATLPPPDAGTGLVGSMAFGVHYSLLVPENLQTSCGYAPSPSTGYGDIVVVLTDVDLSSGCPSGFVTPPTAAAGHPFVRIEVESRSYATGGVGLAPDGGPVAPLVPGEYAIGFEPQPDPDVCMLAGTNGTALVDVLTFGSDGGSITLQGAAESGTVMLTTVAPGRVAGTFQVSLAPVVQGGVRMQSAAPFSGRFDTTTCPGVTQ